MNIVLVALANTMVWLFAIVFFTSFPLYVYVIGAIIVFLMSLTALCVVAVSKDDRL